MFPKAFASVFYSINFSLLLISESILFAILFMSSAVGIDVEKAASLLFEVEVAVEKDYTDLGKTGIVDIVELLDT